MQVFSKSVSLAGCIQKRSRFWPEALVLFSVVKGKVQVHLNDDEVHIVEPGKVLHFDGDNFINAEFLTDGELFVTLVNK